MRRVAKTNDFSKRCKLDLRERRFKKSAYASRSEAPFAPSIWKYTTYDLWVVFRLLADPRTIALHVHLTEMVNLGDPKWITI